MSIEKIIELQERIISRFEKLKAKQGGKFTDELIISSYIRQISSRYDLAAYQLKREHPELFKRKRTDEEKREYMKKYMRGYKKNKNGK